MGRPRDGSEVDFRNRDETDALESLRTEIENLKRRVTRLEKRVSDSLPEKIER